MPQGSSGGSCRGKGCLDSGLWLFQRLQISCRYAAWKWMEDKDKAVCNHFKCMHKMVIELQQRLNVKREPYYVKLCSCCNKTCCKWQNHMLSSWRTGAVDPSADLLTVFTECRCLPLICMKKCDDYLRKWFLTQGFYGMSQSRCEEMLHIFMFGHWLYWTQILNISQAIWFTDTAGGWFTCDYHIYLMKLVSILPIKWEISLLCLFEWFNKYPKRHIMDICVLIFPVYTNILGLPFGFVNSKVSVHHLKNIARLRGSFISSRLLHYCLFSGLPTTLRQFHLHLIYKAAVGVVTKLKQTEHV